MPVPGGDCPGLFGLYHLTQKGLVLKLSINSNWELFYTVTSYSIVAAEEVVEQEGETHTPSSSR